MENQNVMQTLVLLYKMERLDPEYVFVRRGNPLSLDKIQDMISLQKKHAVLVEYFMTKEEIFIFLISSRSRKLHIKTVPMLIEKLEQYLKNYIEKVAQNPHDWWGFGGNGGCLVVYRLVQFVSAVEIVYKEIGVKMTVLLCSLLRF